MAEEHDELLTTREVARLLRVDDTTVRRWVKVGILEAVRPHTRRYAPIRIKRATVDNILNGTHNETARHGL